MIFVFSSIGRCLIACALVIGLSACIRSRVVITSEPPGATVTMNGLHRGKTPIDIPFIWYWYYDFELTQEGYQPLRVRERLDAPFYGHIPFDLVAEILPVPLNDTHRRHYILMTPTRPVPAVQEKEASPLEVSGRL